MPLCIFTPHRASTASGQVIALALLHLNESESYGISAKMYGMHPMHALVVKKKLSPLIHSIQFKWDSQAQSSHECTSYLQL